MLLIRNYPVPENEELRAAEMRKYYTCVSDLGKLFESVSRFSSDLFHSEIGLLSFVEDDRLRIGGAVGTGITVVDRSDAFCTHTIISEECFVVLDALEDPRFRENCYVAAAPYVRFYAGAPLKTASGFNIGALCVAGFSARKRFTAKNRAQLLSLAKVISSRLDEVIVGSGGRAEVRQPVDLHGTVSSYGKKPMPIRVHNLSSGGAMISCPESSMPRGEEVVISFGATAVVATVMWAREGLNGISFHRVIDEQTLAAIRKSGGRPVGSAATRSAAK